MLSEVREIEERLRLVSTGFDPALVTSDDAQAWVEVAGRVERMAAAIRTKAAARAAEGYAWKRDGFRSPQEWLAHTQGISKGQAHRTLELADQLRRHEQTRHEYETGNLSEQQAGVVASAAEENPDAEDTLLATARDESLQRLKEEAARARAEAADEEERQRRIFERRHASGKTDEQGAYVLQARTAAFPGGIFDTIWQRFCERVARDAQQESERLTRGQIAADALVLMAQTALEALDGRLAKGLALPEVRLNLIVGHDTFQTGQRQAGEACEIDGIGPIAPRQAHQLCEQGAFVTVSSVDTEGHVHRVAHLGTTDPASLTREKILGALERDGVDVQEIELPGRSHIPEVLQTALMIRDRLCATAGCDQRHRLQTDHIRAVELDGHTSYQNLQRICWHHHQAKTRHDMIEIRARKTRARARARAPADARAGP